MSYISVRVVCWCFREIIDDEQEKDYFYKGNLVEYKKELEFYDINYTLLQSKTENSEGFTTMGTKNVNGSGLVWVNNTPISDSDLLSNPFFQTLRPL